MHQNRHHSGQGTPTPECELASRRAQLLIKKMDEYLAMFDATDQPASVVRIPSGEERMRIDASFERAFRTIAELGRSTPCIGKALVQFV